MSSGTINATPSERHGGRAFKPGRRWAFVAAAVVALVVAGALVWALVPGGNSAKDTYGSLPTWLPKDVRDRAVQNEAPPVPVASLAHPQLEAEQGYTMRVKLPSGTADVTAVGPGIPDYVQQRAAAGTWPVTKPAPSTFYITIKALKGSVPVSPKDFQVLSVTSSALFTDLKFSVKGGGPVPTSVRAGQTASIVAHTMATDGQGAITWAPVAGHKAVAGWIWQMEVD